MSAATDTDAPIVGSKGNMGGTLIDVQNLVMHFPVTEGILIQRSSPGSKPSTVSASAFVRVKPGIGGRIRLR